ncbi:hypothetical protein [Leptospira noguchii]|uniref:hypothetical protein n=1 Tax=Leptospira noguchii TaxID=28182 RepID=UPI001FB5A80F|nr:hypothetical protein [Leptospira noguchii]UOG29854.1 hypothetical protein MAL06_14605 [Leptospira noguchii]
MKFASCDDDPENSLNAYLWVGVQGVVALSLLFAPIFLRRTHVILKLNCRNCPDIIVKLYDKD